jgi:nicotinate dehydrogenase subunit A
MSTPLTLQVNCTQRALTVSKEATLLHVLRNDLALNSPKYGCGLGECGACTVLVDGIAARACVIPAQGVEGRSITTLEGLGTLAALHPVQQAFIDEQAAQCGYCLSGMVMMTVALLSRVPHPTDAQIRSELSGNLCRCGTHLEIVKAVHRAAQYMARPDAKIVARVVGQAVAQTTASTPPAESPA